MNLVFLDVDGVLNSVNNLIKVYNETKKTYSGYAYPFDENCLKNLQHLVNQTNSKLVISSTWRKDIDGIEILLNKLREYQLDSLVIGCTPILGSHRSSEIKEFLAKFKSKVNFIILDDDGDIGDLLPYLIKTNNRVGLSEENVKEAISILKQQSIQKQIQDNNER